jgi:WD40 repeat protein
LAGHSDNVESCAITPDEKFIISGGWDKCVVIWSVADILAKKPEPAFANIGEHSHFINHVASYGANAVISSSADMTVKLFHLPSSIAEFKEAHSAEASQHTDLICCMDYNPAKQQFVTASWDKTAKVFSNDGTEIALLGEHTKRVNDAAYFPKSYDFIATAATDHTVKIWNEKFICEKTLTGHTDKVMSVAVSHDDRYIASGAADKTIRFWDASTGNCISTIQAHSGWVCALRFSPCSRLLASGSVDSSVKIWSTKDGVLLGTLRKHTNPVLDLSFAQNGNILISGGEDWKARVWQVGTWECICELSGHQHEVTAIVVLDDVPEYREMFKCNTILATASADRTIRIWNYMTGEQLWIHVAPGAFSYLVYMDNLTFAAGDSRGRVYILKLQHS